VEDGPNNLSTQAGCSYDKMTGQCLHNRIKENTTENWYALLVHQVTEYGVELVNILHSDVSPHTTCLGFTDMLSDLPTQLFA